MIGHLISAWFLNILRSSVFLAWEFASWNLEDSLRELREFV
jgi:hypothetical protein